MILKTKLMLAAVCLSAVSFFSCNEGEGLGGKSSIEGNLSKIIHFDDNFSFGADTTLRIGETVYLRGADDKATLTKATTNENGDYVFDHLRKGNYVVFATSKDKIGNEYAETVSVSVGAGTTKADTLFIHGGDIYNTTMIKGTAWVKYLTKNGYTIVNIPYFGPDGKEINGTYIPALKLKVYLCNVGEDFPIANETPSNTGTFIFKELRPNHDYYLYMQTEIPDTQYRKVTVATDTILVRTGDPYNYYPTDFELKFQVVAQQ